MIAALGLSFGAFAALCLSMDRHQRDVFGGRLSPARSRGLRALGWLGIALSPLPCVAALGAGPGLVLWCGVSSAAAGLLVLLVPYAPRAVVPAALVLGMGGLAALVLP